MNAGGGGPQEIAVADFDQDQKLDLAVAAMTDNEVVISYGNGNGTFGNQQNYYVRYDAYTPALCDFNNDQLPDLVVGNHRSVAKLKNKGSRNFYNYQLVPELPLGIHKYLTATGDFNQDNQCDFVTVMALTDYLGYFKGTAGDDFELGGYAQTMEHPDIPVVSDVDNDNDLDVIIYGNAEYFTVFHNPLVNNSSATGEPAIEQAE